MAIVKGGSVDEELGWALAHADEIDPMTSWREDLASAKAVQLADPYPDCGEQHGPTIEAADSGAGHDDASEPGAEED